MITYLQENIFNLKVEAIVNPINCVGCMGGGLARQFKDKYPEMNTQYEQDCIMGKVRVGKVNVYHINKLINREGHHYPDLPKYIINFPTKDTLIEDSKLAYIEDGMIDLINIIKDNCIDSIAISKIGCGIGGLNWNDVHPIMIKHFEELFKTHDVDVKILLR